jgi:hypothetical protein
MPLRNKLRKGFDLIRYTLFPPEKIIQVSETSKVRHLVLPYCIGFGCDVGFGGDKIVKKNCLGIDLKKPYGYTGVEKVDIPCNLMKEKLPVQNNHFDFVYHSHLIEDFQMPADIIADFCRVIKSGGTLISVFPDQKKYVDHCINNNQYINPHHIYDDMGLAFMKNIYQQVEKKENIRFKYLFESDCEIDYNVILIATVIK